MSACAASNSSASLAQDWRRRRDRSREQRCSCSAGSPDRIRHSAVSSCRSQTTLARTRRHPLCLLPTAPARVIKSWGGSFCFAPQAASILLRSSSLLLSSAPSCSSNSSWPPLPGRYRSPDPFRSLVDFACLETGRGGRGSPCRRATRQSHR